jgi:hypothetical protein
MKTKKEILKLLPVLKVMSQVWQKIYAQWMINWYLDSYWFEQFTFKWDNDNEAFQYFEKCFEK